MTTFEQVRANLAGLPAHTGDPDTAIEAARAALEKGRDDERAVLAAVAVYPMTGDELDLLFPAWTPKHGLKRASFLKCRLGLLYTEGRRSVPGGNPCSIYRPTPLGRRLADEWPGEHPRITVSRALDRLAYDLDITGGRIQCLYCPHQSMNRTGAILHEQRAHGIPRVINGKAAA